MLDTQYALPLHVLIHVIATPPPCHSFPIYSRSHSFRLPKSERKHGTPLLPKLARGAGVPQQKHPYEGVPQQLPGRLLQLQPSGLLERRLPAG